MNKLTDIRAADLKFLEGGGECGALIASRDWSSTLGPISSWPQSLKTATALLLRSPVPIVMLWGADGIMLYNDAYSSFAGGRHPELLGSKVREGWPEVADFNDNVMRVGLAGGTLQYRDQELTLHRHGRPEQVWMNLDYSPVIDDSGSPAGVLAVVVETTERVAAERALKQREELLRFFDHLATLTRSLADPFEIMGLTARLLGEQMGASVCAYADMDEDQDGFTIRGDWAAAGSKSIVGRYSLADFGETAVRELRAGRPLVTRDTLRELGPDEGAGLLDLGLEATVCMPFIKAGRLTALMAVHQAQPRDWTGTDLALIAETTERSWAYIERTRSEAVLRESEARLRGVLDGMGESLAVLDQDFRIVDMNAEAMRMESRARDEVIGKTHWEAHPNAAPELNAAYRKAMEERVPVALQHCYEWPDGRETWIDMRAYPIEDGLAIFYSDVTERKQAELALELASDRAHAEAAEREAILSQLGEGVIVTDFEGRITFVNDAAERLHGVKLLGVSPNDYTDTYHLLTEEGAAHPPLELPLARSVLRGETVVGARWRIRRPDGSEVLAVGNAKPVLDPSGNRIGGVLTIRDETDRLAAEAALRDTEERYRLAARATNDAIWDWDLTSGEIIWNEALTNLFGHERLDLSSSSGWWVEHIHPDDRARVDTSIHAVVDGEGSSWTAEYRFICADGSSAHVLDRGTVLRDSEGRAIRMIGAMLDLSERHRTEEALAESEERLRLATEAAEIGFWDLDTLQDELFWPPRVKAMFGISPEALISMEDFYNGLHPDDREPVAAEFGRAVDPAVRGLYDVEYRTIGKEDEILRWVAAKGRGIFDQQGHCVRVLGTAIDITERKRAEAHQRLLIDELSHRAKNLLAIVQSIAHQTLRGDSSPEGMRASFEGRLGALAAAHSVLTQQRWESAPIRRIICDTVKFVVADLDRIHVEGPDLTLSPKTAVSLAMAIHELATNALKYGSLSNDTGAVGIDWGADGGRLRLQWVESGGPPVQLPERRGFGSRMIERGLAAELGGKVQINFAVAGVICTVDAPLPDSAS